MFSTRTKRYLFSYFDYESPGKPIPFLPDTVLLRLVQYAAGVNTQLAATSQDKRTDLALRSLLPYLAVCRSWRLVISAVYYREAILNLGPKDAVDMLDRPLLHKAPWVVQIGHVSDIRHLHIVIPVDALCSGGFASVARKELSAYRSASVLEIILHLHSEAPSLDFKLEGNADRTRWFIDVLNNSMPHATSLSVKHSSTMLAGDLSGLLEIIRSVAPRKRSLGVELDLHGHCPFLTASGPQVLTSISITMRTWTGAHVEFIRYHAETLQALTVHNITTWSLQDLLTDGNRPNVVFPNLMLLDIELRDSRRGQALDIQRTPFPALRCFRNKGIYPFSNDAVLYTDQLSSLEYLRLTMDSAVFTTLNAANAFKSRKYPVLRTVEILVDNNPFVIAEAVQGWSMFAAVFEISETAKVFRCNLRVNRSAPVLTNMRPSFTLEHLYIPWFSIDLASIPLLCLLFPRLRTLACSLIDAIDTITDDYPTNKSIVVALSTKRIRSKLATLEIFGETWIRNYKRFGQYVALLVTLLPSLKELVYWPYTSNEAPEARKQITAALNRTVYRDLRHIRELRVEIKSHYANMDEVYRKQFPL